MIDYNDLFKKLSENMKTFDFGKDGKGWFTGFDVDENGNFKGIDLNEFAKKASEILGYKIDFGKDEKSKENEKKNDKEIVDNDSYKQDTVSYGSRYNATLYRTYVKDGVFKAEIVVPGMNSNDITVKVNTKLNRMKISYSGTEDIPWYSTINSNIDIEIPNKLIVNSLKKTLSNGILTITGKIEVEKPEMFEFEIK